MSDYFDGMVYIDVRVSGPMVGQLALRWAIGREQAETLYPGRPPVSFDAYGADAEWRRRNERAEALARAFSADIAQQILNMVNPDWRRENEAKLRGYTSGVPATNSAGRSLLG